VTCPTLVLMVWTHRGLMRVIVAAKGELPGHGIVADLHLAVVLVFVEPVGHGSLQPAFGVPPKRDPAQSKGDDGEK